MKKLISIVLATLLVLAMGTVAFAGEAEDTTLTTVDTSNAKKPTLTIVKDAESTGEAISVDIVWGAMKFKATAGSWNPETHDYDGAIMGIEVDTGNIVTVTNHSNVVVEVICEANVWADLSAAGVSPVVAYDSTANATFVETSEDGFEWYSLEAGTTDNVNYPGFARFTVNYTVAPVDGEYVFTEKILKDAGGNDGYLGWVTIQLRGVTSEGDLGTDDL